MYTLKLRYGALLLDKIRKTGTPTIGRSEVDRKRLNDLCDRFERVMASLDVEPLVWPGDYA